MGFTIADIRSLLSIHEPGRTSCGEVRQIAISRLESLRERLDDVKRKEGLLADAVSHCPEQASSVCVLLEMLEGPTPDPGRSPKARGRALLIPGNGAPSAGGKTAIHKRERRNQEGRHHARHGRPQRRSPAGRREARHRSDAGDGNHRRNSRPGALSSISIRAPWRLATAATRLRPRPLPGVWRLLSSR